MTFAPPMTRDPCTAGWLYQQMQTFAYAPTFSSRERTSRFQRHTSWREAHTVQHLRPALKHAGLPHASYELVTGLAAIRRVENAEERWFAGDDVLAGALRPPDEGDAVVDSIITAAFSSGP